MGVGCLPPKKSLGERENSLSFMSAKAQAHVNIKGIGRILKIRVPTKFKVKNIKGNGRILKPRVPTKFKVKNIKIIYRILKYRSPQSSRSRTLHQTRVFFQGLCKVPGQVDY